MAPALHLVKLRNKTTDYVEDVMADCHAGVQGLNMTALREIKLLRELNSPHFARLLDVFSYKSSLCLVGPCTSAICRHRVHLCRHTCNQSQRLCHSFAPTCKSRLEPGCLADCRHGHDNAPASSHPSSAHSEHLPA